MLFRRPSLLRLGFLVSSFCLFFPTSRAGVDERPPGADVPWVTLVASEAEVEGERLESRKQGDIANEALDRSCVRLNRAGHFVRWKAPVPANSIVIRYCIPDAPEGGGQSRPVELWINGRERQKIVLSSRQAWLYGTNENAQRNDPKEGGTPHVFFDDARALVIGRPIATGDRIELRWGPPSSGWKGADWIVVDLVDLELVKPPANKPFDFLSVTDFGAVPNDGKDDTVAISACIAAAKKKGKGVWLPPGTYHQTESLLLNGVILRGAGPWHTRLTTLTMPVDLVPGEKQNWGGNLGFRVGGAGWQAHDLMIEGVLTARGGLKQHGFTGSGTDFLIENVWVEHADTGGWLKVSDGAIRRCRFRNNYADGFNINNGSSNVVIEHNHARNNGDDGLASFSNAKGSGSYPHPPFNQKIVIRHNTLDANWWAHGIGIYGGEDIEVLHNLVRGTSRAPGILVDTGHESWAGQRIMVSNNLLLDCGGVSWNQRSGAIGVSVRGASLSGVVIHRNTILRPTFDGIRLQGGSEKHRMDVRIEANRVEKWTGQDPRMSSLVVLADARGSLELVENKWAATKKDGAPAVRVDAPEDGFQVVDGKRSEVLRK